MRFNVVQAIDLEINESSLIQCNETFHPKDLQ